MLKSKKHIFWEALVVTIFIFGIGILFGIYIEGKRAEEISNLYLVSEINLLDVKIQADLLEFGNGDCEQAVKKNIEFADRVYQDALTLEKYEGSTLLTDSLINEHKRYDLLRVLLWLNSMKIKEKCGESFSTVVYLYDYGPEELEKRGRQSVFSNFLGDLKSERGDEIILIPIAKNLDIVSLDLLVDKYKINDTSIIVDEELVVSEISEFGKIREYLDN